MKQRPFKLTLGPNEVAMITEDDGVFVVEPMRFLYPFQARKEVHSVKPRGLKHNWYGKGMR